MSSDLPAGDGPFDAIVVGAGHNGLICAAYLARNGMRTLLLEARDSVGGCASTEQVLGGARVNICNCDHTMVRTSGVAEELGLDRHGLQYLELDPWQLNVHWDGGPGWFLFRDHERTLESIALGYPGEVAAYRRYLRAATPVAQLVMAMGRHVPTPGRAIGVAAADPLSTARALPTLMQWSKRSVGDVIRSFFSAEQLRSPLFTTGPGVWGLSPETPGTGLGALGYAMRHLAPVGRPRGGSGALTDAVLASFVADGGVVRTSTRVEEIVCEGDAVRGVRTTSGALLTAPVVVSAADPRDAFVSWLRNPPAAALPTVERYRSSPQYDGYESKVDAVVDARHWWPQVDDAALTRLGLTREQALQPTAIVSKSLADLAHDHEQQLRGIVADRPQLFVQLPSVLDPTVAAGLPSGSEVFSLEILWTPYARQGGWEGSGEPERWLRRVSELVAMPDGRPFHEHVRSWRHMGPVEYERQFSMTRGYAPSFAGTPLTALLGRNPEQSRYETPVRGLFLTGAGTFPGAGVWGASGRNAATVVLASDGRSAQARRAVRAAVRSLPGLG